MNIFRKALALVLAALFAFAVMIPAFADENKVISEVRLTVTEPEPGAVPDSVMVSAEPDKYSVKINYWIKQTFPDYKNEEFEAGYTYTVVFEVTPASGFRFETPQKNSHDNNESPTVIYVNGEKARCVSWEEDNRLTRAYDWDVTEKPAGELSFFAKIINAVKNFFAGIINFFKSL